MSGAAARSVTIRIAVEDADARRKLEELGAKGPASLQQIEAAARSASGPMQGLAAVSDGLAQGIGRFGGVAGAASAGIAGLTAAAVGGVAAIARAGDEYTASMNRLTSATGSAGAAAAVFRELQGLAAQTGVSVSESAGAFVRFSIAAREVGATNAEVLQLVRTIQQAGIIAGSSTQETSSAIMQLGQALASGKLQGDELRSILESMPTLAEAMARELGVSVGQLRQMGAEGQLTADRVLPALLRAGERINREFQGIPPTITQAFGVLREATTGFLGQLDQALGLSQRIAGALGEAAARLRGAQAAITPLTEAQQAQRAQEGAQARIGTLQGELSRLEAEQPPAARRGSLRPGLTETAAASTDRETRLAALREQLEEQRRIEQQAAETRARLAREAQETSDAEEATAAARRNEAQRRRATEEFNATRDKLDRERGLREEHRQAIARIDAGEAAGATDAAAAARLRARAEEELAEGLRKLEPPARAAAAARREGAQADREAQRDAEEGRRVTEGVRTEAEKYAAEVERLTGLLDRGRITQETYNRAIQQADPALRAARESADRARREQENFERSSVEAVTRIGETAMERLGGGLVNAFLQGERASVNFRSVALSTVASIGTDLLKLGLINPFANAAFGVSRPTLSAGVSSLFGGTTQATAAQVAQAAGGVGTVEQAGMLASASSLYRGITGGISGSSLFNAAAPFSESGLLMGSTGLGSLLNTPIIAASAGTGINAAGAVTNAAGYGSMAANSIDAVGSAAAAGVGSNGLTIGSALGPAAAIGGGIYGIYSGIQKGGVGGLVGGLGGAASIVGGAGMLAGALNVLPALAALGPAGLILGAIGAIGGALLPGQKPSSAAQGASVSLADGAVSYDGNSKNFSQANRDEAEGFARGIANLESSIERLAGFGLGGEVNVGVDTARKGDPASIFLRLGGNYREFARDEAGAKEMSEQAAKWLWEGFQREAARAPSEQVSSIIRNSGSAQDFETNLRWYESTYKALTDTIERTSTFTTALEQLVKPYDEAISKARELGLATEELTRRREQEVSRATAQRDLTLRGIDLGLAARLGANDTEAMVRIALDQAAMAAEQETAALRDQLEALGLSADDVAGRLERLQDAQELEAGTREAAIREQIALNDKATQAAKAAAEAQARAAQAAAEEQARAAQRVAEAQLASARTVLDWLDGQALGGTSSLTGIARANEAQRQFEAALAGGDTVALTRSADAFLTASRAALGGATAGYARVEANTRQAVAQAGVQQGTSSSPDVVAAVRQLQAVVQQLVDAQDRRALMATVGLAA